MELFPVTFVAEIFTQTLQVTSHFRHGAQRGILKGKCMSINLKLEINLFNIISEAYVIQGNRSSPYCLIPMILFCSLLGLFLQCNLLPAHENCGIITDCEAWPSVLPRLQRLTFPTWFHPARSLLFSCPLIYHLPISINTWLYLYII